MSSTSPNQQDESPAITHASPDLPSDPELPFHLRGNYAPVFEEVSASDLEVQGAIPSELRGLYLRNGSNPHTGESSHWFAGDGMIHGVRLEDGAARWYRNRYVQTRALLEENAKLVGEDGAVDRSVAVANTNVIGHAGRIFALVETSFPTEMTPELDTIGTCDFDGMLTTGMTAHPKCCPVTGELHFFGYGFFPPFLTYHRLDASGKLVQSEEIPVAGSTMIHDFAITDSSVIFMDLPVVFDIESALTGEGFPYKWSDDYGARLGVMPRGGSAAEITWVEIDPCYIFHPMNAYERGGSIVLDAARYPELWREDANDFSPARLHRYTIDVAAGKVSEEPLDDRPIEFPRINDRHNGLHNRYGYAVANAVNPDAGTSLIKYDLESGASETHEFGPGRTPGEGAFAPASDASGEDEGWIVTYVYDRTRNATDLVVLDANRFSDAPVATVPLPVRVPFGFHGNWIPDPA
jgi:carotenoid cleavage dioxygenase